MCTLAEFLGAGRCFSVEASTYPRDKRRRQAYETGAMRPSFSNAAPTAHEPRALKPRNASGFNKET